MILLKETLAGDRPRSIREVTLPRRIQAFPSPADWRDEVIYFLLPDRFSDGKEAGRVLLDPSRPAAFRPAGFRFDLWSQSGRDRYQGGTIAGIMSKLDYIRNLGATTLWVGPVFKQRLHLDTYGGYAIQDFLDVDPRLGTRQDVVDLVAAAHQKGLRVWLDIVFNHTGDNWIYASGDDQPPFLPWPQSHPRGPWRDGSGGLVSTIGANDDGVFPTELQPETMYTRAGMGNLGAGQIDDPHAEFRRTDFFGDRDINYDGTTALDDLARCYKYWIALTDCDGLRLDTLKHVDEETGRNFCGTIREFTANLGKANFFLVGEVAGADSDADRYLQVLGSNLSATLDIGEIRPTLTGVAKGLVAPNAYFDIVSAWKDDLGSRRSSGERRVSILDDHDHVSGGKVRFSVDGAPADHQIVAGIAVVLFALGIPCIYYGDEQAFSAPEPGARQFLTNWNNGAPTSDEYLREAMFGPAHPRLSGRAGVASGAHAFDHDLPGFGPWGTCSAHAFNPSSAAYVRIASLIAVRKRFPVLRQGRQYPRALSNFGLPFALPGAGEIIAWSRVLDDEEALCVVNGNGAGARGGDVIVDASLNATPLPGQPTPFFTVVANSAQAAATGAFAGPHPVRQRLPVSTRGGAAFVQIRDLPPAEVLVLSNRP